MISKETVSKPASEVKPADTSKVEKNTSEVLKKTETKDQSISKGALDSTPKPSTAEKVDPIPEKKAPTAPAQSITPIEAKKPGVEFDSFDKKAPSVNVKRADTQGAHQRNTSEDPMVNHSSKEDLRKPKTIDKIKDSDSDQQRTKKKLDLKKNDDKYSDDFSNASEDLKRAQTDNFSGSQYSAQMHTSLEKLAKYMAKYKISDLAKCMQSKLLNETRVTEISAFITFMQGKDLKIDAQSAMMLASHFTFQNYIKKDKKKYELETTVYVDLDQLENAILDMKDLDSNTKKALKEGMKESKGGYFMLQRVYNQIQSYMTNESLSVFDIFKSFDKGGNNKIDIVSLEAGLKKFKISFSQSELKQLFAILDEDGDGRISYQEWCNKLADQGSEFEIKDPSHWAYVLFEKIRRVLSNERGCLVDIFTDSHQKNRNPKEPCFVYWDDFLKKLKDLGCRIESDTKSRLQSLLDVKDDKVDLDFFQKLLGIKSDHNSTHHDFNGMYSQQTQTQQQLMRDVMKNEMKQLLEQGLNKRALQRDMKREQKFEDKTISFATFFEIVNDMCSERIKKRDLEKIASAFRYKDQNRVQVESFLNSVDAASIIHNLEVYLYGQLDIETKKAKCDDVIELFQKVLNDKKPKTVIKEEDFLRVLDHFRINLSKNELDSMMLSLDPNATGETADLRELKKEIEEYLDPKKKEKDSWKKTVYEDYQKWYEKKNKRPYKKDQSSSEDESPDNIKKRKNPKFDDSDSSRDKVKSRDRIDSRSKSKDRRDRSKPRTKDDLHKDLQKCLKRNKQELQDIAKAIERRKSGYYKWFQTHKSKSKNDLEENELTVTDFVNAINALDIDTKSWTINQRNLYQDFLVDRQEFVDIQDVVDVLELIGYKEIRQEIETERVLAHLLKLLNYDTSYLNVQYVNLKKRNQSVTIKDFSELLYEEIASEFKYKEYELEEVVEKYGAHYKYKDEVDFESFVDKCEMLMKEKGARAGKYVSQKEESRKDQRDRPYDNPLMPGQFPTQTQNSNGRRLKESKKIEKGYKKVNSKYQQFFEDVMKLCYLKDVLVETQMERYQTKYGTQKALQFEEFLTALQDIGMRGDQDQSFEKSLKKIFDEIMYALNIQPTGRDLKLITASEIDRVVDYEVETTIPQIQEQVLETIKTEQVRQDVDLKRLLDDAVYDSKNKNGDGKYLEEKQVYKLLTRQFKKSKIDDLNLQVFVHLYKTKKGINVDQLKDDLDTLTRKKDRAETGDSRSGKLKKHKSLTLTRDERQIIDGILKQIKENLDKDDNLYKFFAGKAIKNQELVSQSVFISKLNQYVKLTEEDEDLLSEYYSPLDGDVGKITFITFCDDLKNIKEDNNKSKKTQLTYQQLDTVKDYVQQMKSSWKGKNPEDVFAQMTKAFKEQDTGNKGFIKHEMIQRVIKEQSGVKFSDKQIQEMVRWLNPNEKREYSYKELLEVLVGPEKAQYLCSATKMALQDGSWNLGKKNKQEIEFQLPKQTIGAQSTLLNFIGVQIIGAGYNYEEVFVKEAKPMQGFKVLISLEEFEAGLKTLGVKLKLDTQKELKQYFEQYQKNMKVELAELLKNIGLPPQTIGANAAEANKVNVPINILNSYELAECKQILLDIKKKAKEYKKSNFFKYFEESQDRYNTKVIKDKIFLSVIKLQLEDFAKKTDLQSRLGILVPYLIDEDCTEKDEISLKKLKLALENEEADQPLKQYGAEKVKMYEMMLKNELSMLAGDQADSLGLLIKWMKDENVPLSSFGSNESMSLTEFKKILTKNYNYKPHHHGPGDPLEKLVQALEYKGTKDQVNIKKLKEAYLNFKVRQTSTAKKRFDARTTEMLSFISEWLNKVGLTTDDLHKKLDRDGNGKVDKNEFVTELDRLKIPGIKKTELGYLFDSLDINDDNELSSQEFALYIKGVQLSTEAKIKNMDKELVRELQDQIEELFEHFDEDGDGFVSPAEIKQTLQAMGVKKTTDQCMEMIKTAAQDVTAKQLNKQQFANLMLPMMQKELLSQDDNMAELRQLFAEADSDGSGTLTVDELWHCCNNMGANLSQSEVIELMRELDVDQNGSLDVDEFVSLLRLGGQVKFNNKDAQNTYMKIRRAQRLNPLDFLKAFQDMPSTFAPSFIHKKWAQGQNLPSSVFKAQVDPETMLWKDVLPPKSEDIPPSFKTQPKLKAIDTLIGCCITLDEAQGVPMPKVTDGAAFKDEDIVKRAIRIAIEGPDKQLVHNSIQSPAYWDKKNSDVWSFDVPDCKELQEVVFRTTKPDQLDPKKSRILFELIIYVKTKFNDTKNNTPKNGNSESLQSKVTEMSCGWAELSLEEINKADSNITLNLNLKGGDPESEVDLNKNDVRVNRSGLKLVQKVFSTGVNQKLMIKVRPFNKLDKDIRNHIDFLPSTCLVHRSLLLFASGFMNYKAERLLKAAPGGAFRKPPGDSVLSSFPKIFDCPDIVEELGTIWSEDYVNNNTMKLGGQMNNIDVIVERTSQVIQMLYPILYSEAFSGLDRSSTSSAVGDPTLKDLRKKLVHSALRYGQSHAKVKANDAPHELTYFKPFNVRELEFDVWDTTKQKQAQYMDAFSKMGFIARETIDTDLMGRSKGKKSVQFQKY